MQSSKVTTPEPHSPASFNVMLSYLRGLALDVDLEIYQMMKMKKPRRTPVTSRKLKNYV